LRKQALESERKMADMLKKIEKLEKDLTDTVIDLPDLRNQITLLLKIAEEDAIHRAIAARDWQIRFEQLATEESE
jgi:hypothetical protein